MATATITWTTNEAADSRVLYRLATAATWTDSTLRDPALVTAHSVVLTGLAAGTAYAFQARSRDAAGNLATAAGTFTTAVAGPPPAPPPPAPVGVGTSPAVTTGQTASSRRQPYPYDLKLNGVGLRLAPDPQSGAILIGRKVQTMDRAVPNVQEYGSGDIYRERDLVLQALRGMGERALRTHDATHYRYAINAWFAGEQRGKGPLWHALTPASSGEVRDFPEALHGGVLTQFILAGRYCLRRVDDTAGGQTVSKDFGVGRQAQAAVRYKDASGAPVDGLYVALDNKELWRYDGAVWAQMGTSATLPAQYVTTVGDELWRGYDNYVSKLASPTTDPSVAANWAAPIRVGDASSAITSIVNLNSRLVIFKDNGRYYTVNGDGSDNDLSPGFDATRAATNGRNAAVWQDYAWFREGNSFWRLSLENGPAPEEIGLERLVENDTEVAGPVTCFAGYGGWYGFLGVYNPANGNSYLLQLGNWLPPRVARASPFGGGVGAGGSGAAAEYVFVADIHGALVRWQGEQITALRVSTLPAGNPRLYAGFASGKVGWCLLPINSPNPLAPGSGCEFTMDPVSEVYWPVDTMLAPADHKSALSLYGWGPVLDASNYVNLSYRTDPTAAFTAVPGALTGRGVRVDFPANTYGKTVELKESFVSPSSASTPVLEELIFRRQLRPAVRLEYAFTVRARSRQALRNGATDRHTPAQIHETVKAAADTPATATLILPDETVQGFNAVQYGETIPAAGQRYGMAWDLPVSFVQFKTNAVYGTIDRGGGLTINDLGGMTINDRGIL